MLKNTLITVSIMIGFLIITDCSVFELPEESGVILFQDDFSSPNSGWDRYHDGTYSSDYDNGAYRIVVSQQNHEAWALPGLNFSDVIVEVTATKVDGPEDNVFGILCRYQNPQNFYFFLISSDGYAGIGLYHNGNRQLLSGDTMLPTETIIQGSDTNTLKAHCVNDLLTLEVNGSLIYEIQSDTLLTGDVGLIAGTYEQSGITVNFDNFAVRNP